MPRQRSRPPSRIRRFWRTCPRCPRDRRAPEPRRPCPPRRQRLPPSRIRRFSRRLPAHPDRNR
ncbi:MAG: hypothetical protein DUD39_04220 [Coriobacteriaceae bacterium]|nr:MAG: hypothetical protein DUD39_04220 [Coriobacteriaceae bacterium]